MGSTTYECGTGKEFRRMVILQKTGVHAGYYKVITNLGVVSYVMNHPPAVPLPRNNGKWMFHALCATIEKKEYNIFV